MCGCLSTTAKKKMWENPTWSDAIYDRVEGWLDGKVEGPRTELKDDEDIKPLPPLDK